MKKFLLYLQKKLTLNKNEIFKEVYKLYVQDRGVHDISELAFERIIKVYPALLVISTDGFVDIAEVDTLSHIASDGTSISTEIFTRELKNLYLNQGHWRNLFIKAIKETTQNDDSLKEEILMNMIYAAASSTGSIVKNILLSEYKPQKFSLQDIHSLEQIDPTKQFFSHDEKQKIIQIAEELQLLTNEELKNKVYQLFS